MEFYQELLLTAVISTLLAFLIGKLAAAIGSDGDDLDRDPTEKAAVPADPGREQAAAGGGEASPSIEEKQVRGGLDEEAKTEQETVDDGRRAAEVLGSDDSDRIEADEVGEDEDQLLEGGVARSDEAGAGESDLEKGNSEEERSEVNDARLEGGSVEETPERMEIEKIDSELAEDGVLVERIVRSLEETLAQEKGCQVENLEIGREQESCIGGGVGKVGSLLYGEDEWEGIETTELEKLFEQATAYVGSTTSADAVSRLSNDVQMQLYGLFKIATEGPCYEPQPLALKVSARAKWHAWQRQGNMNPEEAMEQYTTLLSHSIPGWMGEKPGGDAKQDEGNDPPEEGVSGIGTPDPGSSLHSQPSSNIERELEDPSRIEGDNASAGPKHTDQGLTMQFFLSLVSPTTVRFSSLYW